MPASKAEKAERERLAALGLKKCTRCKGAKSVSGFGKKKRNWDGLDGWCKQCNHDYKQDYRNNPENRAKERAQCKDWKSRNRQRVKEYNAEWNAANPELKRKLRKRWHLAHKETENAKARARSLKWAKENREHHNALNRQYRARKFSAGGFHTEEQIEVLFELCNYRCLVCGETEGLAIDHIQPLNKGGTDRVTNLQILCKRHNGEKGDHHATDYRPDFIKEWAEEQVNEKMSRGT